MADPHPQELFAERDSDNVQEASVAEIRIRAMLNSSQESIRLRSYAEEDNDYQQLLHHIRDGFPDHRSQLPDKRKAFWGVWSLLSVDGGLVVYGCRLLISVQMRRQVLTQLHDSHTKALHVPNRGPGRLCTGH